MINVILGVSNFGDLIKLIADNCPGWLSALIATLATTGIGSFIASVIMLVRNKIKTDSVLGSFNKAVDRVDNKLKENENQTKNTIAEFSNIINRQTNPIFILPLNNVIINKRSSRKISFSSGDEGWFKPELELIPEHIQVECVTIGSRRNAGRYSSNNVTYVINDEQTITVYNDTSDYQACVDILVVFSGVVGSKKDDSVQQN